MRKNNLILVGLMIVHQTSAISYNQPKFCPMVSWNPSAITFLTNTTIGRYPSDLFVSNRDVLYISGEKLVSMNMSSEKNNFFQRNVSDHLLYTHSVFATINGDVYFYSQYAINTEEIASSIEISVHRRKRSIDKECISCWDHGWSVHRHCTFWGCACYFIWRPDKCESESKNNNTNQTSVNNASYQNHEFGSIHKWSFSTNSISILGNISGSCADLFIDNNNTIYCSKTSQHQVVKKSLDVDNSSMEVVAGNGSAGLTPNMLNYPLGIFVSSNFSLYVADSGNDRIQLFSSDNDNGSTIAGNPDTILLKNPTGVVLDADQYLYISDYGNNRIIGSGPNGFRCLVGCTRSSDAEPNQVFYPTSLNFDRDGNIFVADDIGSRILKFLLATNSCDLSYNQPKFCSSAAWESEAVAFANTTIVGSRPYGLLVDASNTVYLANVQSSVIHLWSSESADVMRNISNGLSKPYSLFVTRDGTIYIDDGQHGQVNKWSKNQMSNLSITNVSSSCYGLFVDLTNTIYCSMKDHHQVLKQLLNDSKNLSEVAAGDGIKGSEAFRLNEPYGIFVHTNLSLYVTDSLNNRIQRFEPNLTNGTTVAGTNDTFVLKAPTGVVLDADAYLFIVDSLSNRIVGAGANGFRCLVGCSGQAASHPNALATPASLSFDSYGNMFVVDTGNSRLQKFLLQTNSCDFTLTSSATETTETSQSIPESTQIKTATTTAVQFATTTSKSMIGTTPPSQFMAPNCDASTPIGGVCDKLKSPCEIFKPCLNNGNCSDNDTSPTGYSCSCLPYYNGTECQFDYQPCKLDTCWNKGECTVVESTATFNCTCRDGWEGKHCEIMINFCKNISCMNGGVCRPSFLNYTCECLGESYSGRHCNVTATKLIILKIVSKSFAYVAILALLIMIMFIVIMDVLKYGFGIDPVKEDREWLRRRDLLRRRKPVIQRFIYVHDSSPSSVVPIPLTTKTTA